MFCEIQEKGLIMTTDIWSRLTKAFPRVPVGYQFVDGDTTDGAYTHGTSILGISFTPDDSLIAIAGGGCIPGVDATIRLIDPHTMANVRTLIGHVHGIHDLSFDPESGILASASFDYGVYLWNLECEDVIALMGGDDKTKGHSRFMAHGSILVVGEYAYYGGPHTLSVFDLASAELRHRLELADERGVGGVALSADSKHICLGAQRPVYDDRCMVIALDAQTGEILQQIALKELEIVDMAYIGPNKVLASGIDHDSEDLDSMLVSIDLGSGEVVRVDSLDGCRVFIDAGGMGERVVAASASNELRLIGLPDWTVGSSYAIEALSEHESICRVAFNHGHNRLAFGTSSGRFGIVNVAD
ncbi:MAG: hypothetical protein H6818_18030 [Phycisphaerales bacterium]|nr:hypothetical protein [Phycisphaerales bacterium]MCB9864858.1 hypothetical protein [Phycisphaerales bacterium]